MGGLLDASMTVRYLTGDPPDRAEWAASIIDVEPDLQSIDGVMAYVLGSVYSVDRPTIVARLIALVPKGSIRILWLNRGLALQALLLWRPSGRVSIADAVLWAVALATPERAVYSLDTRFPAGEIEVHGP